MIAHLLHLYLLFSLTHQPWVLIVYCDSWATSEMCTYEYAHREHSFESKQEALDWIHENYVYVPGVLHHGEDSFDCRYEYLDAEDSDSYTRMRKIVTCDDPVATYD